MRLAMWSGPRNLSTAMMYCFGHRSDVEAVDEPFYACYLARTGQQHPLREEILASQPTDPIKVVENIRAPLASGQHRYLKLMTHHMLEGMPQDWLCEVTNVFLIRHPARVVASFALKHELASLEDLGIVQQLQLFRAAQACGQKPIVVDATDILAAPERMVRRICEFAGIKWDPEMLSWPSGGHPADGVWAPHWYGSAHVSTGFVSRVEAPVPKLSDNLRAIADQAMGIYDKLREHCLKCD